MSTALLYLTTMAVITASQNTVDIHLSSAERAAEASILSMICIVAVVGNVSLWIIILTNRSLKTLSNVLILCLSGSDLMVSSINMPVTVYTISQGRWTFSHAACVVIGYITMTNFITSVMSLGSISINRYLLICHTTKFKEVYTKRNTALIVGGTWLLAASLASPPLIGWGKYDYLPGQSFCFCSWTTSISYTFFMVGTCFGGPCSVMSFCYIRILREVRASRRRVGDDSKATSTATNISTVAQPDKGGQVDFSEIARRRKEASRKKKRQEDIKLTASFVVVVVVFICCWMPFCITMFWSVFTQGDVPRAPDITTLLLGCMNSCCNPIIYGVMNTRFREGFKKLYCGRCRFGPAPHDHLNTTFIDASSPGSH